MLKPNYYTEQSEFDQLMFEKLVQAEHYLRKVKTLFDFESTRALVADCYSADTEPGRHAEDPYKGFLPSTGLLHKCAPAPSHLGKPRGRQGRSIRSSINREVHEFSNVTILAHCRRVL